MDSDGAQFCGSNCGLSAWHQMDQTRWWEQEIPIGGPIQKGQLLTYNLTELIKPESYLVRLTPITRYAPVNPHLSFYMFIETSRPRLEGDKARLMSPTFNINTKSVSSSSASKNPTYCFTFYYHMFGKHIGALNIFLRLKGQMLTDTLIWSLTGNQGNYWQQARVNIHPTTTFQVVMEGVRGSGIEGNIAIDDVTIEEGECKDSPSNNLKSFASQPTYYVCLLYVSQSLVLIGWER
ncbi:MAM domain-containing glycosylphosphatidylinositol anchor protein 2-like isoform X5 [Poecilia formosa]|uniref:MAM domain-containing glycosylphosphatidylinositol anchor protein 2-like isoform X5 n=2 Tax=Poecilia TaxID=8080 RepID=UPI0007BAA03F|nr:PREDICTED: MAM domain-containing glycosylphosphatidylinositol anchor protein 2-like isoform X5 [Poecilia formosa]